MAAGHMSPGYVWPTDYLTPAQVSAVSKSLPQPWESRRLFLGLVPGKYVVGACMCTAVAWPGEASASSESRALSGKTVAPKC